MCEQQMLYKMEAIQIFVFSENRSAVFNLVLAQCLVETAPFLSGKSLNGSPLTRVGLEKLSSNCGLVRNVRTYSR